jgi:hypothetical protein
MGFLASYLTRKMCHSTLACYVLPAVLLLAALFKEAVPRRRVPEMTSKDRYSPGNMEVTNWGKFPRGAPLSAVLPGFRQRGIRAKTRPVTRFFRSKSRPIFR